MAGAFVRTAFLAAVCLVWAWLGASVVGARGTLTPAWSPAGIALAALLLAGYRIWPGVTLGAFFAAVLLGRGLSAAGALALTDTLEAVLGVWLLRRFGGFESTLARTRDVVGLPLLGAGVASAAGATLGTASLWAGGELTGAEAGAGWALWWVGHAADKLVMAPLVLIWAHRGWLRLRRGRAVEAAALVLALLGMSAVVFTALTPLPDPDFPLASCAFPLIAWAALRFGRRGVTSATFLVMTLATWGTLAGGGPFARGTLPQTLALLHGFLLTLALTGLALAAVRAESERRTREAEAIGDLARTVNSSLDLGTVLQRIADGARDLCGSDIARITTWEPGRQAMVFAHWAGTNPEIMREVRIEPGRGLGGLALATGRPVRTANYLEDPRITADYRALALEDRTVAGMVVPILIREQAEGLILVFNQSPRPFTDRDEEVLVRLADHAAIAIENSRLFTESERRRREAEALSRVAQTMAQSHDVAGVGEHIARTLLALFDVHGADLRLLEPDGSLVSVAWASAGAAQIERGHVLAPGVGLAGRAVREGRPVWSPDVLADPEAVVDEDLRAWVTGHGGPARLSVPLVLEGTIIGVLTLAPRTERAFTAAQLGLIQAFADQAALAIEHARLFEENRLKLVEMSALYAVSRALAGSLEVEEIVQKLHDQAGPVAEARQMEVILRDAARGDLEAVLWTVDGRREPAPPRRCPEGLGLTSRVMERRRPLRTDDYARACLREGVEADPEALAFPHWLAAPMIARDQVVGAIVLRGADRAFTAAEERLLANIAGVAALAIAGARLFEERVQAHRAIETAQEQVLRSERLSALGEMAAGVAHDFNNTLATIAIRTDLMTMDTDHPGLRRHLQVIQQAALDGARTVRRIQEFTRRRRAHPFQAVDLNHVVNEVIELTRPRWRDAAQAGGVTYEILRDLAPVPRVAGDPSELREALINLIFNALDAMPDGGRLGFRTGVERGQVVCEVSDTGVGMAEDVRERAMDPFFTTKSEKGSGLGLSVVYGIVTRHGGDLEVWSEPGRGSRLTLRLPIAVAPVEAPPPAPAVNGTRNARILVIDDEPAVLEALRDVLGRDGHQVVACPDGPTALDRFAKEAFDLVITDLGMPRMSGWEVAATIKAARVDLPVLMITGWGDQIEPDEARAKGVDAVLAKPFTTVNLVTQVKELLSTRARPDPGRGRPGAA